ncbi:hypothetical protein [Parafrankia sp. BMG5.11]|uniref:hypothetical protein n=1 Tax=Parafrankia sp. BMG5.11 TaxID=222540 RepID=UPI001040B45F|nr:hypothetical protein [Parafrankia sp. BMG5.11]TCJ41399.1 hypothetical protein E0504_02000 [Parafrankia sp. BMG5.11]
MITLPRFRLLEAGLRARGYDTQIDWSETILPPLSADLFAEEAIYVICNSGMANRVALSIYNRCLAVLKEGGAAKDVFGHPGKAAAIDRIWLEREELFADYAAAEDKVEQLRSLPFIGSITALHLAKNFGVDTAKPDVHLERLARRENTTTEELCARLAAESGYRVATIDTILWRACADRILNSQVYELEGWDAAFKPIP